MKAWLRRWLGIIADEKQLFDELRSAEQRWMETVHVLQNEIRELRAEIARLTVAQYVPPSPPEEKRKVIQTHTMKEFNAILEREFEAQEAHDAG